MTRIKKISMFFIFISFVFTSSCGGGSGDSGSSGSNNSGSMKAYGVDFARTGDFAELKNKGDINLVSISATDNWQNIFDAAAANGQKVVLYLGFQEDKICQGSDGWDWNGSDWALNGVGQAFLDFIADYIKNNGKGFLALYTLHEPFNTDRSPNCTAQVQQKLYNLLKQEANQRGLTSAQLPLFADVDDTRDPRYTAGICDYCSTWDYPNGECNGATWEERVNECIAKMRSNYIAFETKSPKAMFVVKVQSFGDRGDYDMPSAADMEYLGNRVIADLENNYGRPYLFIWYVWEWSYPDYLKNSPGGNASFEVLANVYQGH